MPTHVVCYVQRKRITDWKRLVLTHDEPAFIYGSNDERIFASTLRRGSTLWIVSSIPGRAPELVARLKIAMVAKRNDPKLKVSQRLLRHFQEFDWIAKGLSTSEFFGHNDAGSALLQTVFKAPSGTPWLLDRRAKQWHGKYGMKLQRPTLICSEGVAEENLISPGSAPFEKLAESKVRSVFISWKWRDNSKDLVRSLAYSLAEQGFMPWLDLLALPQARALEKIQRDAPKLESLLRYGYGRCLGVIAIDSAHYGVQSTGSENNWTLREWTGKLSPEKEIVRISFQPKGAGRSELLRTPDVKLHRQTPDGAARELREWFDSVWQPRLAQDS